MNSHATVKTGEYEVLLIGVPKSATQESCSLCGHIGHLTEFALDVRGRPLCSGCLTYVKQTENQIHTDEPGLATNIGTDL